MGIESRSTIIRLRMPSLAVLAQRPGKYGKTVNELLGTGAFGEVYKMDSPADSKFSTLYPIVAVKKIRVSSMNGPSITNFLTYKL